jgi:hypothetical protein
MKVKKETFSEWGTLVSTITIESDFRTFRQFANNRGVYIAPGDKTFTTEINKMKLKYTKL